MHLRKAIPTIGFCAISVLSSLAMADQKVPLNKVCLKQNTGITISPACGGLMEPLPQVSCYLPSDVEGGLEQENQNIVQRATDIFSWQAFIALNWPAQKAILPFPVPVPLPLPVVKKEIVWQTWKSLHEVFPKDGKKPPALKRCGNGDKRLMLYDSLPNVHNQLNADLQAAVSDATLPATLTDQDGHLTRYDIRINPKMVNYIVGNGLNNAQKQKAATSVSFPNGSIVIKAAWREVNKSNEDRFYTTEACVCERYEDAECQAKTMGLVGMHIVTKTPNAPQWIWSTYEQVDNVVVEYPGIRTPSEGEIKPGSPSYYDPNCKHCPPNKQTPKGVPAQLTRLVPIPSRAPNCSQNKQAVDDIKQLNLDVQNALGKSSPSPFKPMIDPVFQYYELVNTQWSVVQDESYEENKTDIKAAIPPIVANLTMESYVQQTSTCIGCHSTARTINPDKFVSSDFTFVLSHNPGMPTLEPECQVNPPVKPEMTNEENRNWELENWEKIMRGSQLLENTYEELPYFTNTKLHCTSCHLNGGGDPNAAWWVPMVKTYNYPETQNLQARVNRCFQRSMNGHALCVVNPDNPNTADNCQYDDNMIAIVTYMEWLNRKANDLGLPDNCIKITGFPPIVTDENGNEDEEENLRLQLQRNPVQGQAIYVQKCAVCHGVEGQGRYEHDTYHRPAVWGPDSFNFIAGIGGTERMAEFLKANMPLDAGGMLTAQEAWDVAAFLNECHCRPGRSFSTDGTACELSPNCPSPK